MNRLRSDDRQFTITAVLLHGRILSDASAGRLTPGSKAIALIGEEKRIKRSRLTSARRSVVSHIAGKLSRGRHREDAGQSLLEFALVLPLLLLVVTGITTFGIALNNYIILTNSVTVGARLLSISRGQTTNPCSDAATAIQNAAPMLTPGNLTYSFVLNGTSYTGATCSSSDAYSGAAGNLQTGKPAQVTVNYPCNLRVFGIDYAPTCSLQAQITELVQ
jgi:Flp pilus assembly protein TadG